MELEAEVWAKEETRGGKGDEAQCKEECIKKEILPEKL